jgi:hypothetical protein
LGYFRYIQGTVERSNDKWMIINRVFHHTPVKTRFIPPSKTGSQTSNSKQTFICETDSQKKKEKKYSQKNVDWFRI